MVIGPGLQKICSGWEEGREGIHPPKDRGEEGRGSHPVATHQSEHEEVDQDHPLASLHPTAPTRREREERGSCVSHLPTWGRWRGWEETGKRTDRRTKSNADHGNDECETRNDTWWRGCVPCRTTGRRSAEQTDVALPRRKGDETNAQEVPSHRAIHGHERTDPNESSSWIARGKNTRRLDLVVTRTRSAHGRATTRTSRREERTRMPTRLTSVPRPSPRTASIPSEAHVGSRRGSANARRMDVFRARKRADTRSHASAWSCVHRMRWIHGLRPTHGRSVSCSVARTSNSPPFRPRPWSPHHHRLSSNGSPRSDRWCLVSPPHVVHVVDPRTRAWMLRSLRRLVALALPRVSFETRSPTSTTRSGLERDRRPRSIGTIRPFERKEGKEPSSGLSRHVARVHWRKGREGVRSREIERARGGQPSRGKEVGSRRFAAERSEDTRRSAHDARARRCAGSRPSPGPEESATDARTKGKERREDPTTGGNEGVVGGVREHHQTLRTGRRTKRS